jgi:hypothetical protein
VEISTQHLPYLHQLVKHARAPAAGAILSTFVASYSVSGHVLSLPTRAAFHYCFDIAVVAFIAVGLLSIFAREVIGKNQDKGHAT